jgi:hypothetical protein
MTRTIRGTRWWFLKAGWGCGSRQSARLPRLWFRGLEAREPDGKNRHRGAVARSPPSRPGEFHPEPLTEPDLDLSTHPARASDERLKDCPRPPTSSSSGCPLTHISAGDLLALLLGNYPDQRPYRAVRPWPAHWYFRPHGTSACAFSLPIANQVLKFRTKAQTRVTPPYTGHRTASE